MVSKEFSQVYRFTMILFSVDNYSYKFLIWKLLPNLKDWLGVNYLCVTIHMLCNVFTMFAWQANVSSNL